MIHIYKTLTKAIKDGDDALIQALFRVEIKSTMLHTLCPGCGPLSTALERLKIVVVKELIQTGHSTRFEACPGSAYRDYTALHFAAEQRSLQEIQHMMLSKESVCDLKLYHHVPALHLAVVSSNVAGVETFLKHYENLPIEVPSYIDSIIVRPQNSSILEEQTHSPLKIKFGKSWYPLGTALHTAAAYGELDSAKLLLAHGANVNNQNTEFSTPLHHAAAQDRADMVKLLLDEGADIEARDHWGLTPIALAAMYSAASTIHVLHSSGASLPQSDVQVLCKRILASNPTSLALIISEGISKTVRRFLHKVRECFGGSHEQR